MDVCKLGRGLAVVVWMAGVGAAVAEPLPKEECDRLKVEHSRLEATGAKENFAKGANWGRTNLGGEKLRQVERYIQLEEQLIFRCGLASARIVLPLAEEDTPPAAPDDPKVDDAAAAAPKPKPKPKPKVVVMPPDAPAATKEPPPAKATPQQPAKAAPPQPAAAKPAPKPKPKVEDAYRPPAPANPTGDPFAGKVQPKLD